MRSNVSPPTVTILGTISGAFLLLSPDLGGEKKSKKPSTSASSARRENEGEEASPSGASSESIPDCTVCPGVPRYSMKGATTTATRMTRATCWVLTSARRAPTRGARNGLVVVLLLLVLLFALEFELTADADEAAAAADDDRGEGEGATFLLTLSRAPSTSPRSTETTCSVQSSDASLPARGATAAARGRDQASPAKAAAIVLARSHETSELFFFLRFASTFSAQNRTQEKRQNQSKPRKLQRDNFQYSRHGRGRSKLQHDLEPRRARRALPPAGPPQDADGAQKDQADPEARVDGGVRGPEGDRRLGNQGQGVRGDE